MSYEYINMYQRLPKITSALISLPHQIAAMNHPKKNIIDHSIATHQITNLSTIRHSIDQRPKSFLLSIQGPSPKSTNRGSQSRRQVDHPAVEMCCARECNAKYDATQISEPPPPACSSTSVHMCACVVNKKKLQVHQHDVNAPVVFVV